MKRARHHVYLPRYVPTGRRSGFWSPFRTVVRVFRVETATEQGYVVLVPLHVLCKALGRARRGLVWWETLGFPKTSFELTGSACRRWYSVEQVELAHRLYREVAGDNPRTALTAEKRSRLFAALRADWATCTTLRRTPTP